MIDKSNIEHWLFQYHEGLLSNKDKTALFDFLANHPEFYKEFALWAHSKLNPDPKLEDLELENSLLRQTPKPHNTLKNKWTFGTIFIGTSIMLSLLLLCKTDQGKSLNSGFLYPKTMSDKNNTHTAKLPNMKNHKILPHYKNQGNIEVQNEIVQVPDSMPKPIFETRQNDVPNPQLDTLHTTKASDTVEETLNTSSTKLDTAQIMPTVKSPEKPKATPVHKNKKRKSKIDLGPSKDFIKDNSDF